MTFQITPSLNTQSCNKGLLVARDFCFWKVWAAGPVHEKVRHPFILRPQFLQFLGIWLEKSGSRNLVWEKVVVQKKRWFYPLNPHFFRLEKSGWPEKNIRVWRTTSLEPLLYTFLENRLQNKWSSGAPTLPHGERTSSKVVGMMFPLVEIGLRPGFPGFF